MDSKSFVEKTYKVFVSSLSSDVPTQQFLHIIELCGKIVKWTRPSDILGRPLRFGFVEFSRMESAVRAVKLLNGRILGNLAIKIIPDKSISGEIEAILKKEEEDKKSALESSGFEGISSADIADDLREKRLEEMIESLARSVKSKSREVYNILTSSSLRAENDMGVTADEKADIVSDQIKVFRDAQMKEEIRRQGRKHKDDLLSRKGITVDDVDRQMRRYESRIIREKEYGVSNAWQKLKSGWALSTEELLDERVKYEKIRIQHEKEVSNGKDGFDEAKFQEREKEFLAAEKRREERMRRLEEEEEYERKRGRRRFERLPTEEKISQRRKERRMDENAENKLQKRRKMGAEDMEERLTTW